ncbi:MAG: hypothetical protein AAFR61_23175 [Bacteroidota bacterium]
MRKYIFGFLSILTLCLNSACGVGPQTPETGIEYELNIPLTEEVYILEAYLKALKAKSIYLGTTDQSYHAEADFDSWGIYINISESRLLLDTNYKGVRRAANKLAELILVHVPERSSLAGISVYFFDYSEETNSNNFYFSYDSDTDQLREN